jgi:organic hydroperoxide reductase OsmC/OhrA
VVDADLGDDELRGLAEQAKAGCPVSKALAGVGEITLQVTKA